MTSRTRPASSYHKYGPHIFHTNSDAGRRLSLAVHRMAAVRASRAGERPRPAGADPDQPHDAEQAVRRRTSKTDEEAADYLAVARRAGRRRSRPPRTSSSTRSARELYELFFRGYTRKQWGLDPSRARQAVTSRIPTRTNTDDRYFSDTFQAMPLRRLHGDVRADARQSADRQSHSASTFATSRTEIEIADHIIYTGPIDEYFDFRFGKLPYRSLKFDHQTLEQERFQPVAVVNYPERGRAVHAHQRVQASDRAGASARRDHLRISVGARAIPTIRSRGRRIRSCSRSTRRSPTRPRA